MNDVRLRDRTSAFQGNYSSEELMYLRSDTTNSISIDTTKSGSPVYTIQYVEQWPVILKYGKNMRYSGREINDREFVGNNLDFAGSSLLYNQELSKDTYAGLLLKRMNATVLATDDAILSAEFMPSREMIYRIKTHTTGIADLKYRLTEPQLRSQTCDCYPALSEGEERYVGTYNISRSIHIKSDFEKPDLENSTPEDWLPCCFAGWSDMNSLDKRDSGVSAKEIFDCSCGKFPAIE